MKTIFKAIKSIIAFDTTGCIMRWQFFDHAAHLGGALFGMWVRAIICDQQSVYLIFEYTKTVFFF